MSNVLMSVYSLANKNNGFFKSEKQAQFLISQLEANQGVFIESFYFGEFSGAKASRTVFVIWDNQGITEIKTRADVSRKESVKFIRISDTEFAAKQSQQQAEKEQSRLDSIISINNLIAEQKAIIDAKASENAQILEKAKQSPLATAEIIESLTASMTAMLEIQTKDQVKLIAYYTEKLNSYL